MAIRFTEVHGVVFCEENLAGTYIQEITVKAPTQNTTLAELKNTMASKVKSLGGNALVNFTYTQKADKLFRNPLKWDSERLTGHGRVIKLEKHPGQE